MRRKVITTVLVVIFSVIAVFSGWKIYEIQSEYSAGEDAYSALEQFAVIPSVTQPQESSTNAFEPENNDKQGSPTPEENVSVRQPLPNVDFTALQNINSDINAWLYIEGTNINYPVAQCEDNTFYLDHLFDKTANSSGCLFLDYRNEPDYSDSHSIIYGHHMRNGAMFSDLNKYTSQAFYDSHKSALLITPDDTYRIEFFAGYVTDTADDAWQVVFQSDSEYEEWIQERIERSFFKSEIVPTANDKIVTLNTCSYEADDARFVLLGVLRN